MHGPSPSLIHPFDEYPLIPVVDSVVTSLSGERRRMWKRRRNYALNLWSVAGPAFVVTTGHGPYYDPSLWQVDDGEHMLISGAIHLVPGEVGFEQSNVPAVGWLFPAGGFAYFNMIKFWQNDASWQKYVVTHETGHALGLGHRTDTSSVMYGTVANVSARPDAHDLKSLVDFYT